MPDHLAEKLAEIEALARGEMRRADEFERLASHLRAERDALLGKNEDQAEQIRRLRRLLYQDRQAAAGPLDITSTY